ncbi:MAG: hypothetical protein JXR76_27385 [Deltaproteobacteria bacterium]|nr:hypothetical protein [Deltaproteobacteria bacterium]
MKRRMDVFRKLGGKIVNGLAKTVISAGVLMSSSCNYAAIDEVAPTTTTPEKVSLYHLVLDLDHSAFTYHLAFHPWQTWLSLSYAPFEAVEPLSQPGNANTNGVILDALKVRPKRTPWAAAWDRESVVLKMNDILSSHGIASESVRVRMIAHAIVASGWKQNVWNFNAWGVRQGSWDKKWYEMPTFEEDDSGKMVFVEDASWRAFSNWEEAIRDYQQRISADSERPSYREAHRYLVSNAVSFRHAKLFWESLGDGNYYTASNFTGAKFARLCGGVRAVLRSHQSTL